MKTKYCMAGLEVPFAELRQQLDYARTVSADVCEVYSRRTPSITELLNEYASVRTKLSMLQDFLFQASLWCDTIMPENDLSCDNEEIIKEEE